MSARLGDRWASCDIRLPDGMLVIAPVQAFGLGAQGPVVTRPTTASKLRLLAGHPEGWARLRADWGHLRLAGDPSRMSPAEMTALLEAAVDAHRLAIAFFPQSADPLDRLATERLPTAVSASRPPPPVRDMSRSERIEAALKKVPAHLTGPLKEAFLGLISPTSIAVTVGAFAALAVAQFFGYGEAADAVLAAIAYGIAGLAGVRALYDMVAATVDAALATNDADIDAAAKRLAEAFVVLGMAFLTIFVARAARRAAQSRAAAPPPAEPEPPASLPPRRAGSPNQIGAAGEAAVRSQYDIGPKVAVEVNGRTRIPDGLTDTTLSEVKNVQELSYTQQLRDFADYANSTGRDFDLYVRPGAKLSGPLLDAIQNGDINLKPIPTD